MSVPVFAVKEAPESHAMLRDFDLTSPKILADVLLLLEERKWQLVPRRNAAHVEGVVCHRRKERTCSELFGPRRMSMAFIPSVSHTRPRRGEGGSWRVLELERSLHSCWGSIHSGGAMWTNAVL